jgi:hypothetical protein
LRAEIKAGELLREMAKRKERDIGHGGDRKSRSRSATVKLEDLGVTNSQSSRWQTLAGMSKAKQEEKIDRAVNNCLGRCRPSLGIVLGVALARGQLIRPPSLRVRPATRSMNRGWPPKRRPALTR